MLNFPRSALSAFLLTSLSIAAWGQASIRRVHTLASKDAVEIEIEASDRLTPQTQVLTGPDRLVIDFPNAVPGAQLRNQSINRGEVKDVRFGLFQSKPPVTRLVLDLNSAQSFQVFPSGRTVMIKVTGNNPAVAQSEAAEEPGPLDDFPPERGGLVDTKFGAHPAVDLGSSSKPVLEVTFRNGLLSIHANKASLSQVLYAVHERTGADVAVAAGAEQEQVVADIGPAPAQEVVTRLLYGSRFNFLILGLANDPRGLERVVLTPRTEGGVALPQMPTNDFPEEQQPQTAPPVAQQPNSDPALQMNPGSPPDANAKPSGDVPD